MIKVVTELVKRNGTKYFNEFLTVLYSEECYKQFVISVIRFNIIYKYLLIKGMNATTFNKLLNKDEKELLCDAEKAKDITNENYFLELIETKTPDFHMHLFQLLTTDKNHKSLLRLMFKKLLRITRH